jgi:hypothetical protein
MTPLCELAREYKCDKAFDPALEHCHVYTPVYHHLYDGTQDKVRAVLEVGVNTGASLRMWRDYFPQAKIIGLDINPHCLFTEWRIRCFHADQRDELSMHHAMGMAGIANYDLIIDDGSHEIEDQILTMRWLVRFLAPDGLYFVEDVRGDLKVLAKSVPPGFEWRVPETPGGRGIGVTDRLMVIGHAQATGSR